MKQSITILNKVSLQKNQVIVNTKKQKISVEVIINEEDQPNELIGKDPIQSP